MVNAPNDSIQIWESGGFKIPYIPYTYKHVFAFETRYWNPHRVHNFIIDYWHMSILIVVVYVFLIHAIKALMRERKPLRLSRPLLIWNVTLALFSIVGTIRSGEEFLHVLLTRQSFHDSVCFTYDPAGAASIWNFLFITSKVAELVDTIFIVLRKKNLIFLHWYHHAAVLIVTWHGAQMIMAPSRVYIFMNYFVHSFMYTYYAITATGKRPNRFCAMFITTIQNLQMLLGVLIALYTAKVKWLDKEFCHMSDKNLALCFFVYLTFGILFCRFFINTYLKRGDKPMTSNGALSAKEEKKTN